MTLREVLNLWLDRPWWYTAIAWLFWCAVSGFVGGFSKGFWEAWRQDRRKP